MFARLRLSPRWHWYVGVAALLIFAAAHMASVAYRHGDVTDGDIDLHRRFGERFLNKAPLYDDHLCFNYMPISALFYVPLALCSTIVAFLLRYVVAVVCLGLVLRWLWLMVGRQGSSLSPFVLVALTIFVSFRFVMRDLDDGGPHLIYLAMLVGGWYAVWRRKELVGGLTLGLVIAVKMSPALLLPYLAWKRRWRLLGITTAATAAWTVLPALWFGPGLWWQYQQQWNGVALGTLTGRLPEDVRLHAEQNDLRTRNQSLRLALLHPLVKYPPGHRLNYGVGYWSVLDLDPRLARLLMNVGLFTVLGAFWWVTRRRWAGPEDPALRLELAGLLLLMLLLSPVTWNQHLCWVVPAVFFLLAARWPRGWCWLVRGAVGVYALLGIVQSRALVGLPWDEVMLSWHIHTAGMLLLLGLICGWLLTRRPACGLVPAAGTNIPPGSEAGTFRPAA